MRKLLDGSQVKKVFEVDKYRSTEQPSLKDVLVVPGCHKKAPCSLRSEVFFLLGPCLPSICSFYFSDFFLVG